MNVTEETKAHAQEILDYLLANPEKHDQEFWVENGEMDWNDGACEYHITERNFCGTTMCIAGTSVYLKEGIQGLNDLSGKVLDFVQVGATNLGLDTNEAHELFYTMENEIALDMVNAIANGDEDKFKHLCDL